MRVTLDLSKKSTQIIDLSDVINPRVGDDDLLLPLHIVYGDNQTDMRGKDVEFLTQDTNNNNIYIAGTCNTNTPGDNLYMGDLTFRFPAGTFKVDGTYDPDKTMFRIVDKATQKVISSANVKITVMKNAIEFNFDPDKSSYDSRAEAMLNDFKDKGQAMLDEIKDLNNQAKSNVSGDTATTAKAAKQQADANAGDISDLKEEVAGARGRYADLPGREDAQDAAINQKESIANANANYAALRQKDAQQDTAINQKESIANANANYAALRQKDAQQDTAINQKAGKLELENKLSQMSLIPEAFENSDAIKKAYPNGKTGIMVAVDTGHKWIWFNGQWNDCGIYQSEGNAEVEDARKWAKIFGSKTSDSLAEAIQGQDLEILKTIFSKIEEPDISAPISESTGYYVDYLSGAINTYTPNGGSTAVASVDLEPGALYVIMSGLTFHPENHTEIGNGYAFYGENGEYIEGGRQVDSIERAIVPLGARSLKITATGNSAVTVFYGLTCVDEALAIKGRIPDAQNVGDGIKLALDGSDTPITTFRWSDGYFVNSQSGVLVPNQSYSYTDLTPVYGLHQLYIRSKSRVNMAFFDGNQKFISGVDVNSALGIYFKRLEIPEDAVYARFSVYTSTKNSLKVQFKPDYPSLNRGAGGHEDIDFGSLTPGNSLGQSGELVSNVNYSYSDAFFMKPSQPVWLSAKSRIFLCEYDENGELVGYHDINYLSGTYQQLITTSDKTVFARLAIETNMSSELRITYDIEGREYHVGESEKYTKILDAIEEATRYMSSKVYVHQGTYNLVDEFGADFFSSYSSSSPVGIMLKNKVHVIFENAKVTFMYDGSNQEVIARFSPFNSSVFGFTLENLDIECQNCRYAVHDERGASSDSYSSIYKNCHIVHHGVGGSKHYCIGAGLGHNATFTVKNCILDGLGLLVHNDFSADDNLAKSKIIISGNYFDDGANIELEHTGGSTEMTEAIVSANSLTNSDSLCLQRNPYKYVHDNIKLYAFANEFRTKGESSPGKTDVDASTSTSAGASESTSTATSQAS